MPKGSEIPLFQVDAFTRHALRRKPGRSVPPGRSPLSRRRCCSIAAEMNLSETAFVEPPAERRRPEGFDGSRPRWRSPFAATPPWPLPTSSCGSWVRTPPLRFDTLSGILTVSEDPDGWLRMDFPADPPDAGSGTAGLLEGSGLPPGHSHLPGKQALDRPAEVRRRQVRGLAPDMTALGKVDLGETPLGVSVTAPGTAGTDFCSRFFGPWVGVNEDPVTGMAHTVLGPYWMEELGVSPSSPAGVDSGGDLRVRREGDRIQVSGQAVTVVRGKLRFSGPAKGTGGG